MSPQTQPHRWKPPVAEGAPVSIREASRLAALAATTLLDSPHEARFDELVRLAIGLTHADAAVIGLVDRGREWWKASAGVALHAVPRATSFADHAIAAAVDGGEVFVVADAASDDRFAESPLVTGAGMRACAAVPIAAPQGDRIGALCVFHRAPGALGVEGRSALRALARQVEALVALRQAAASDPVREAERRRAIAAQLLHDLRDPISVIQANAQFALIQPLGEGARGALEDVVASTRALHDLVLNLLDLSRAEGGDLAPRLGSVDVAALVRDAVLRLEPRALGRRQRLALITAAPSLRLRGDADQLRRMVEVLVEHAIKYSPDEGAIRVEVGTRDGAIELRVSDAGPGVPHAIRDGLFECAAPDEAARDEPGGRSSPGLGLPFCRIAAACHGGRVWIEDTLDGGACFCVSLPAGEAAVSAGR